MKNIGKTVVSNQWPDELDAVAAAPQAHRVLFENDRVRVLESNVQAGETVPVHTHRWASVVYVLKSADYLRYDGEGNLVSDSRDLPPEVTEGEAMWLPPLAPHSVKNIGRSEIRVINFEIKDQVPSTRRHD